MHLSITPCRKLDVSTQQISELSIVIMRKKSNSRTYNTFFYLKIPCVCVHYEKLDNSKRAMHILGILKKCTHSVITKVCRVFFENL